MTHANPKSVETLSKNGRVPGWSLVENLWNSLSYFGLVFGTLFFAASVTPSLLPRTFAVQGILSGSAIAVGYGTGVALHGLWTFLGLPILSQKPRDRVKLAGSIASGVIFVVFVNRMTDWQNSTRELMQMPRLTTTYPVRTGFVALVIAGGLIAIARLLRRFFRWIDNWLVKFLPRKVSLLLSGIVVAMAFSFLLNDVVARQLLRGADGIFHDWDQSTDDHIQPPTDDRCGGPESLIAWDQIGRQGKSFLVDGPTADEITAFTGRPALRPLRIYAGIDAGPTLRDRAEVAVQELKRQGGFDRSILVVTTTTGTGWVDPGAVDTLEFLHDGDTAMVTIQYSYLPSWMTLIVDPDRSRDAAHALFQAVYHEWTRLPENARPRLYVYGLSLGALGAESSVQLWDTFDDPVNGVLLSGPPSPSTLWAQLTRNRNEGSPMWLPSIGDGSVVRFSGQQNSLRSGAPWKSMRWVYLQYASDPMTFCSPDLAWQKPAWLNGQRGPDVSPHLQWFPVVTFLQVAFDLPLATTVPPGYGHNYSPATYIDGWEAITAPGLTADEIERLKLRFRRQPPP